VLNSGSNAGFRGCWGFILYNLLSCLIMRETGKGRSIYEKRTKLEQIDKRNGKQRAKMKDEKVLESNQ